MYKIPFYILAISLLMMIFHGMRENEGDYSKINGFFSSFYAFMTIAVIFFMVALEILLAVKGL